MIQNSPMTQLLIDKGCQNWALTNEVLIVWDNEEDPPAPLTRPAYQEATSGDEQDASTPDSPSDPA
jgi:hypothetical protein